MKPLEYSLSPRLLRWELAAVCFLVWILFISLPISQGGIGLSWDALNHHIYLGWIAETLRFDRDFLAASSQSNQFPYLYWPVYKMAISGWSGLEAGIALATMHLIVVPPVWMLARTCLQNSTVFDVIMRFLAVLMAIMSSVVLSQLASTSNDLMAAAPLVWAVALALAPLDASRSIRLTPRWAATLSGLCAGAAVACKLSNGPLVVIIMPALWLLTSQAGFKMRLFHTVQGGLSTLVGYLLVYGYWGAQMWSQFGNPIYPFYDSLFAPLRRLTGWMP